MITIIKPFQVITQHYPATYTLSSDLPCVSFSVDTGTTYGALERVDISFDTEACLDNATITLTVTDAKGCTKITELDIINPCLNSVLSPIAYTPPYTFSVTATSPELS